MMDAGLLLADLLTAALIFTGLSPRFAKPLYRPLLFRPAKYPEGNYQIEQVQAVSGLEPEDIYFTSSDGTKLHGWYFANPSANKALLFHHGNAGNATTRLGLIQLQVAAGLSVFIYDYRGYGRSEGLPDPAGICRDGCAAFDFLIDTKNFAPSNIVNYGESLGAAVACQVSRQNPGAGLILQSGFCSLRKIGTEVAPWIAVFPGFLFPRPPLDNVAILEKAHPPLMILHGMKDQVVPFHHGQELARQASEPKRFVQFPDADHSDIFMVDPAGYKLALEEFMSSLPAGNTTRLADSRLLEH